jgi:transcriptional regulator with XRE-family HTH domain
MSPSDKVARRIRAFRKRRGYTLTTLADRCRDAGHPELSMQVLHNIESGRPDTTGRRRRDISVDELIALANVLGTSVIHLLPEDVEPDATSIELRFPSWQAQEAFLTAYRNFSNALDSSLPPSSEEL